MKLYIAVLDQVPDHMVPVLVAHSVLWANEYFKGDSDYDTWFKHSFKKVVVSVNSNEWKKIITLPKVYLGHEIHTLNGQKSCAVICPYPESSLIPNVLKFAKLWSPQCQQKQI